MLTEDSVWIQEGERHLECNHALRLILEKCMRRDKDINIALNLENALISGMVSIVQDIEGSRHKVQGQETNMDIMK